MNATKTPHTRDELIASASERTAKSRCDWIEMAYFRDHDDLANQIVMLDEELSGVRPKTAPVAELQERLDYWLTLASTRWTKGGAL
jgi:hypothetical protein